MTDKGSTSRTLQYMAGRLSQASTSQLLWLAKNRLFQRVLANRVRSHLFGMLEASRSESGCLPSVQDDRITMALAITESFHRGVKEKHLSDSYLRGMLQILVKTLFIDRGNPKQQQQFQEAFGKRGFVKRAEPMR